VAVYGRQRIGKTNLIKEFYSKNIIFSFSGLRNGTRPDQIENFLLELRDYTAQFKDEKPENWLQAFSLLI
jgi:AAA+ ATPase superfamily predicted ATPase